MSNTLSFIIIGFTEMHEIIQVAPADDSSSYDDTDLNLFMPLSPLNEGSVSPAQASDQEDDTMTNMTPEKDDVDRPAKKKKHKKKKKGQSKFKSLDTCMHGHKESSSISCETDNMYNIE